MRRGHYTQRYDALNFAMMCDRFGVSDRVASCLATALFEDINFRDVHGNLVIMDKSKVAREKVKSRDAVLRTRHTNSSITAFSFDGRKDDSITTVKINDKFHTTMVKEPHLVVLKEPYNELLGYVNLGSQEDAKTKHRKLNEFFKYQINSPSPTCLLEYWIQFSRSTVRHITFEQFCLISPKAVDSIPLVIGFS